MAKTSIWFSGQMDGRREAAKEITGYADQYIYEHGLLKIESEIAAATERGGRGGCVHPDRYPSGLCRFCLAPPAVREPAAVPPVAFKSGAA